MQERITQVQAQHAQALMQKAHVVGVGLGLAMVDGQYSEEMALVVLVDCKVPLEQLAPVDRIPCEIDGVRVDVQETGTIAAS